MSTAAIRAGRAFVELFVDNSRLVRGLRLAEAQVVKFGNNIKKIGKTLFALGTAASAPFGLSVKTFADFDDQMRKVAAFASATDVELAKLTQTAKRLGQTTAFTASQVAAAMTELAKAGFKPDQIEDAIEAMLNLARAADIELAQAAEIVGSTLNQFGLKAADAGHVADLLASAANASQAGVLDLGEALGESGTLAKEYGMSLSDVLKNLGALSNVSLKGTKAGGDLKRIMTRLVDPKVQAHFRSLGVSVADDAGNMRNLAEIMRDVGQALDGVGNEKRMAVFKNLFGLNALAGGASLTAAQFEHLNNAIDNCAGSSQKASEAMDAGIGGAFRKMYSAIESVAIAIGEALAPSIQKMNDWVGRVSANMAEYISKNQEVIVSLFQMVRRILMAGAALIGIGLAFVGVGKTIGIVTTVMTNLANVALAGLTLLGLMIQAITSPLGLAMAALATVAGACMLVRHNVFGLGDVFHSVMEQIGDSARFAAGTVQKCFHNATSAISNLFASVAKAVSKFPATVAATISQLFQRAAATVSQFLSDVSKYLMQFYDVQGLVLGIRMTISHFKLLGTIIQGAFELGAASISLLVKAFTAVASTITSIRNTIVNVVTTIFDKFKSMISGIFSGIKGAIMGVLTGIYRVINDFIVAVGSVIYYGFLAAFANIASILSGVIQSLYGVVAGVWQRIASLVSAAVTKIAQILKRLTAPVFTFFSTIKQTIASLFTSLVATVQGILGRVVAFLRKFFVIEAVIQIVYRLGKAFHAIASAVSGFITVSRAVATETPGVFSRMLQWIQAIPQKVADGCGNIGGAIGNVFSGVTTTIRGMFSGLGSFFSSVFGSLGTVVSGFGSYFVSLFGSIGSVVDWFKTQLGSLTAFASETFSAIAIAVNNGDLVAAFDVVWASLKLIWVKGSNWLLSNWYHVIDTLQTAWAKCVFKIGELLVHGWFGVQSFWTDAIYTMQSAWINFTNGIKQAWDYVSTAIAQGIGWIMAKIMGLDPEEMAKTITEDYNNRTENRQKKTGGTVDDLAAERNEKIALLDKDKRGTLGALKDDFDRNAQARSSAYDAKLTSQEQELAAARAAYDEAIHRAKNPPVPEKKEVRDESPLEQIQRKLNDTIKNFQAGGDLESKVSVSGSFSAAAISAMGAGSVMDRVAKATEKSEKHLEKLANRDAKPEAASSEKKEIHAEPKTQEDVAIKEMKNQTQILRDISTKGGVFV